LSAGIAVLIKLGPKQFNLITVTQCLIVKNAA